MIKGMKRSQEAKLTIAIPTYNRPDAIEKQIRLLLPQLNNQVQLIVYDNFSEPSVKSLFIEKELNQFTLIRNRVNVGGDANIARCFENCETMWLWTLSDDDFVRKDVVEYLLEKVNNNSEAVFLNFCEGHSFKTVGFKQIISKFKSGTVFTSSFTMSSCLYNMDKLQSSLFDYYSNLSSMVGTIILVLKYIQRNDDAICRFIDDTLIENFNDEVGWDYRTYVRRTRLFVEAFSDRKQNKEFNRTLFLGCYLTNYWLIANNRNQKKVSVKERWVLFLLVLKNQGFLNATRNCPRTVLHVFKRLVLSAKIL